MGKIDIQSKGRRDFHKSRKPNKRTKQEADIEVDQFVEFLQNNILKSDTPTRKSNKKDSSH